MDEKPPNQSESPAVAFAAMQERITELEIQVKNLGVVMDMTRRIFSRFMGLVTGAMSTVNQETVNTLINGTEAEMEEEQE